MSGAIDPLPTFVLRLKAELDPVARARMVGALLRTELARPDERAREAGPVVLDVVVTADCVRVNSVYDGSGEIAGGRVRVAKWLCEVVQAVDSVIETWTHTEPALPVAERLRVSTLTFQPRTDLDVPVHVYAEGDRVALIGFTESAAAATWRDHDLRGPVAEVLRANPTRLELRWYRERPAG